VSSLEKERARQANEQHESEKGKSDDELAATHKGNASSLEIEQRTTRTPVTSDQWLVLVTATPASPIDTDTDRSIP